MLRHSRKRIGHVMFLYSCVTSPPRALPSDSPFADEDSSVSILLAARVLRALSSDGYTRHIAPSLRLFVPNSLTVHHRTFSSKGCACKVSFFLPRCFFPFRCPFSNRYIRSISKASSSRAVHCQGARRFSCIAIIESVCFLSLAVSLTSGGHNSWGGRSSPTSGSSYSNAASFFASEGTDPSTRSISSFFITHWKFRLHAP
jgi:hypothetical protein